MEQVYRKLTSEESSQHHKLVARQPDPVRIGRSILEYPSPREVKEITSAFPGTRRMTDKWEGDFRLMDESAYANFGLRLHGFSKATEMVDRSTLLDDEIHPYDPVVFLRQSQQWGYDCEACKGEISYSYDATCENCLGAGGYIGGAMVTVARDQDDWYWVGITKYHQVKNYEMSRSFEIEYSRMFKCDQMEGLRHLGSSRDFTDMCKP